MLRGVDVPARFDNPRLASKGSPVPAALAFEGPAADEPIRSFEEEVRWGLSRSPKRLSPKHLYDEAGSALFDRICSLDEYYLTRTELQIMRDHGAEMAGAIGPEAQVIELGAGSVVKIRLLLEQLDRPAAFAPIDISGEHLEAAAAELSSEYPQIPIVPVVADFTREFRIPAPPRPPSRRVVYFPGSTIGNFESADAQALLRAISTMLDPGDGLLIGVDLVKDEAVLRAAYDDREGVTAAFITNVLARLNRELDGDFDLGAFDYLAEWQPGPSRMAMFLVSNRDQLVRVAGERHGFRAGERLLIEYSHKYTPERFAAFAEDTGFRVDRVWTDANRHFSVQMLTVR